MAVRELVAAVVLQTGRERGRGREGREWREGREGEREKGERVGDCEENAACNIDEEVFKAFHQLVHCSQLMRAVYNLEFK